MNILLKDNLRKATWFDFVDIHLHEEQRYSVREMSYFIYSEKKDEYQEYKTTPALQWVDIERFADAGLLFVEND